MLLDATGKVHRRVKARFGYNREGFDRSGYNPVGFDKNGQRANGTARTETISPKTGKKLSAREIDLLRRWIAAGIGCDASLRSQR